jgi:hypothetical protein
MNGLDKLITYHISRASLSNGRMLDPDERVPFYRGIGDPKAQEAVTVDFDPVKESRLGDLAAKFDVVLGLTPGS